MRNDTKACRLAILLACLTAACGRPEAPSAPAAKAGEHREHEGHEEGHEGHEGHDHGEASDLDRPIEALFAASCEHGVRTYECDECRYEVGVVKVARAILDGGLVRTGEAALRAADTPIELTGEVRFDERRVTHLSSRTDGVIRAVHVQAGDVVKAGQPLIEIDSIALGDAQGEYLEARAARNLAARTLERQKALRRDGVTSEREAIEAENAFESADIRVRSASERLLRLGLGRHELAALGSPAVSATPRDAS